MFGWDIGFDKPWYLLLLGSLPLLWVFSFSSLAGLGPVRRIFAIGLRTLVFSLCILALAEIQLLRISEKLTVIYVLDQSQSIPAPMREAMVDYVIQDVKKNRNQSRRDRAGVVVFAAEAKTEITPFDDDLSLVGGIESDGDLRTDATDLAAALKLAQALFDEDSAKRVVVVTDGNENLGDARGVARSLTKDGIGIDVVPIKLTARSEIDVEKVALPPDLRTGQTVEARVVINNHSDPGPDNNGGIVKGKLKLSQFIRNEETWFDEPSVTLQPGKNVFSFRHDIQQTAMFTYKATFTPDDPTQDVMKQNNQATAYTHVVGEGHVLLIEDWEHPGQFDFLIKSLREQKLEVTVQSSDDLFTNPIELLEYDTIVLANVPRSSGGDPGTQVTAFSDEQIQMLARNTEEMGCGLVMLGGQQSFGAGGWSNTELEKAMPVDFQIKNKRIEAVGALVLLMHASEMAQGNHWQKVVAREAVKTLGPLDYCGLLHWDNFASQDDWLWGKKAGGLIRVGNQRKAMISKLDRMTPGDMPQFDPAMKKALSAFSRVKASVKHMIVISDGDPAPPTPQLIQDYIKRNVQVTTVAIGTHGPAGSTPLQNIATATGGKYYKVTNPKALPRIYQREARRVSRPLIFEPDGGVKPIVNYQHEMLGDIDRDALRRLKGYVMTTKKQSKLVEQSIYADKPDDNGENSTILASWNYGLGRTVAFTSDTGQRWANSWTSADYYDKFFEGMIRWSMRPVNNDAKFTVATNVKDGKGSIIITALDKDDEFLNFLNVSARALDPDMKSIDVKMRQDAPGRYVGEFDATKPGSYIYSIIPDRDHGTIRGGVTVPFSSELRERETNKGLLVTLASLKPKGGEPGVVILGDLRKDDLDELLKTNTYRHNLAKAVSSQDVWPWVLVLCATLFLADVFVRRVSVSFEWLAPVLAWMSQVILRREREGVADERIARLRRQKEAISEKIDERRAATRFEPQPDSDLTAGRSLNEALDDASGASRSAPPPRSESTPTETVPEEDSYTSRLLRAKKQAFKDQDRS